MSADVVWSAFVWTLRGLLCTWRFFWVSPYYAINAPQPSADTLHKNRSKPSSEKCVQRERTSALHRRLLRAEGEIQELKIEISNQRASWDMRFVELQKRQHDLREQLTSEILGRSATLYRDADSEEACEVFTESGLENGLSEEQQHRCSGGLKHTQKAPEIGMCREDSLCGGQGSWPSVMDTRSWRSGGRPHRVFVPHSPLDLRIGHRVRIMLPSGRISTGTLRYLGRVSNSSDCHLGVELEEAENGQHDGTCEGQRYFDWFESCLYHSAHKCNPFRKRRAEVKLVWCWSTSSQACRYRRAKTAPEPRICPTSSMLLIFLLLFSVVSAVKLDTVHL